MDNTVWETSDNRYYVLPGSSVSATCGQSSVSLGEWQQKYGQERGSTVLALPDLEQVVSAAEALLQ